jgi:prepilin-type N-terminal cleavage/methylation domain-containing protein
MQVRLRRLAALEDGFTLAEMLVVLVILGIVLAGLTVLFTSGIVTQKDQTNRVQAQQDARLSLDKLRREIHCASTVTPTTGFPVSSITVQLAGYCSTTGGAATTVTWCTKDKNGNAPPGAGGPYTLWRYVGSACSGGSGQRWASNIVDAGAVNGNVFVTYSPPTQPAMAPPLLTLASTSGTLGSSTLDTTFGYVIDPVTAAGEQPGLEATVTLSAGTASKALTLDWSGSCPPYSGVTDYKIYGRTPGSEQLLTTVNEPTPCAVTSFTDNGSTTPSGSSPVSRVLARIGVDIPVRLSKPGSGLAELKDDIVLRNTPR